jgi:hypothetical protein
LALAGENGIQDLHHQGQWVIVQRKKKKLEVEEEEEGR